MNRLPQFRMLVILLFSMIITSESSYADIPEGQWREMFSVPRDTGIYREFVVDKAGNFHILFVGHYDKINKSGKLEFSVPLEGRASKIFIDDRSGLIYILPTELGYEDTAVGRIFRGSKLIDSFTGNREDFPLGRALHFQNGEIFLRSGKYYSSRYRDRMGYDPEFDENLSPELDRRQVIWTGVKRIESDMLSGTNTYKIAWSPGHNFWPERKGGIVFDLTETGETDIAQAWVHAINNKGDMFVVFGFGTIRMMDRVPVFYIGKVSRGSSKSKVIKLRQFPAWIPIAALREDICVGEDSKFYHSFWDAKANVYRFLVYDNF